MMLNWPTATSVRRLTPNGIGNPISRGIYRTSVRNCKGSHKI